MLYTAWEREIRSSSYNLADKLFYTLGCLKSHMMFIKLWTNSFWTSVSHGITMPQAYLSESSKLVLNVLEHYLDFGDGKTELQRWRLRSTKKNSLKTEPDLPRIYAGKQCEANYILEELNEIPKGSIWDPLLLNPSRDCMDSCNAVFPSQDIKWKGVELARVAAELAWVCGPSGSFLAHVSKGSCGSSLEAVGFWM